MPQDLGLAAKIEPTADRSSTRKMKRELERELEDVESMEFQSDGSDFQSRTMPSGGAGGGGGMGGGALGTGMSLGAGQKMGSRAAGGGAAKSASRGLAGVGGGAMAAGAGVAATVALGGVLANKMYDKMSQASGVLSATNSIWAQAFKLFWKPFGDALGKTILPYAKAALKMATNFNKIYQDKGLKVAVGWLSDSVESALGLDDPSITIPSPDDVFSAVKNFDWDDFMTVLEWAKWIYGLTWAEYVGKLVWRTWVNSLTWDNFLNFLRWADFLNPLTDWSPFIDFLDDDTIRDAIFQYVDIQTSNVLDWLFGDFSIGRGDVIDILFGDGGDSGDGGGGGQDSFGGSRPSMRTGSGFAPDLPTTDEIRDSVNQSRDINVKASVDGRRLFEGVSREQEDLLRRV